MTDALEARHSWLVGDGGSAYYRPTRHPEADLTIAELEQKLPRVNICQ
jgi:hypothetical protein